jgi:hypothetical protein
MDTTLMAVLAGNLDGCVVGLRPRIGKEDIVHARDAYQCISQCLLSFNAVQIGGVYQAASLLRQCCADSRVGMTQSTYGNTA